MNIVFVRHLTKKKQYAFEVPEELVPYVAKGNTVVCKTSRGDNLGMATTGVFSGPGAEDIALLNGATFPLAPVIGVWDEIPMKDIQLPFYLRGSLPHAEKLGKRIDEYRHGKVFRTTVRVDENGMLQDGYSAYCIAKILDLETLPVFMEAKQVQKQDETKEQEQKQSSDKIPPHDVPVALTSVTVAAKSDNKTPTITPAWATAGMCWADNVNASNQ